MGCFDTLSDGEHSAQVKCFGGNLKIFHKGETVPPLHYYEGYKEWPAEEQIGTYTIVLPGYVSHRFAVIKDGTFVGLTNNVAETGEPYVAKWGELLERLEDFVDFFTELIQSLESDVRKEISEEKKSIVRGK